MACECHACYHPPPGGRGHPWAPLTLQFLSGIWVYAAYCACKASLPKLYAPVWSVRASDVPGFVVPQGILSIVGNSQHVVQEGTLAWKPHESDMLQGELRICLYF